MVFLVVVWSARSASGPHSRLQYFANADERFGILVPRQPVHGGGLFARDAIDKRTFAHHHFQYLAFAVGVKEITRRLHSTQDIHSSRERIRTPVAHAAHDE